jgi:5-methylcytosine-specific restriction endonuclease McrA
MIMAYKSKEKEREHAKAYYEAHKEEMKAKFREYDRTHKKEKSEYNKLYRQANKEELDKYSKQYYNENREKILESKKEYYIANRKEILKYKKEYQKNKCKRYVSKFEYWKIFADNGGELKCALCDTEEDLLIHHKDANHKNNDINNLQCLCRSCHTIVHNKLRAEMRRINDENTD